MNRKIKNMLGIGVVAVLILYLGAFYYQNRFITGIIRDISGKWRNNYFIKLWHAI